MRNYYTNITLVLWVQVNGGRVLSASIHRGITKGLVVCRWRALALARRRRRSRSREMSPRSLRCTDPHALGLQSGITGTRRCCLFSGGARPITRSPCENRGDKGFKKEESPRKGRYLLWKGLIVKNCSLRPTRGQGLENGEYQRRDEDSP
ncbi:hypothetical protein LIER_14429 [Lithospermum erythrorhizon]|uniref:Uncharacterized protein n=1 Tax=Lithospermum erythrorhizon TaxID=34254 RepID=A0AAV3PZK3_LITER